MKGSTKSFPPDTFPSLIFKTTRSCKIRDHKIAGQPFQQVHPEEGNSSKFDYHIEIQVSLQLQL